MRLSSRLLLIAALGLVAMGLANAPATAESEVERGDEPEMVLLGTDGDLTIATNDAIETLDGVRVEGALDELGVVQVAVTDAGQEALDASGLSAAVLAEYPMTLFLDESTVIVEADAAIASGTDGTGALIAVIDSGVDPDQGGGLSAFGDRIVAEACFLALVGGTCPGGGSTRVGPGAALPCTTPATDCAHGTHVAGIAASSLAPIEGVAPAAGIVAIRVMKEGGGFAITTGDVLSALDHVLSLVRSGSNIAAVNLSLGGSPTICTASDAPTAELRRLYESAAQQLAVEGVAVVAASGNSADRFIPVTDVGFPACLDGFIAVGATERDPGAGLAPDASPEVTTFTQFTGTGLDIVAPGFDIQSAFPGGSGIFDGTSMAAPHVAAAFALLDGTQAGWTPQRFAELLRTTGEMVERRTADPDDRHHRYPELRLLDALAFVPFDDATSGFWVEAADWAKYTEVSTGIGDNLYDPETVLNRAQAVTFLWRLMGEPAPVGPSGFSDVPDGTFYTEAVAWAAEQGITTGTSGGRFEPLEPVTRAQMATFLWRLVGTPSGAPAAGFSDVPSGAFFTEAVDWMAVNGITTGTTPTTFSPDDEVTRAQMITFIWRLVNAPDAWSGEVAPPELVLF